MTHRESCPMCNYTHECTHYENLISIAKTNHPSNEEVVQYCNLKRDCLSPQTDCEQIIYLQGTHDFDLLCTPNAPKSCTMQKMLG